MKKIDFIIITLILVLATVLRLYKISAPVSDLHSWRQADTSAVTRNFVENGIDIFKPTYDDLSSLQTGYENPNGLRMVEMPLYNAISAIVVKIIPNISVEVSGRMVSIFFSLISIIVIYYIALCEKNRVAAIFSALSFSAMPYIVFFSRVVLPESTAVSFAMLSVLTVYLSFKKSEKVNYLFFSISIIFFAVAILIKPTTIFYGIAIALFIAAKFRFETFKVPYGYIFGVFSLLPFILWRWYITQFPEGIPANAWLFTMVNTFEGPKEIFFRPAFFRWIFMERIGSLMLGMFGAFFLALGILGKYKSILIPSISLSSLVYLFTFQGGNVQHEYYQTVIFPAVALLTGSGVAFLHDLSGQKFNKLLSYPVGVIFFIFMLFFSYYNVKNYYSYPQDLNQIAELIKLFTDKDDKIVTDRMGDTTLLYLSDRKGAPAIYKEPEELKNLGYSHIVTANKDTGLSLINRGYKAVVENDLCTIVALN
jgi:4-amino-4-deoxy-L-arabinose transferase-like glycosyltransferase